MTYEEMKAKKEALEKDLAELNKEMQKHENEIYEGKLNKAIALLEECRCYYGLYTTVGELKCPNCDESVEIYFDDFIDILNDFAEK